MSPAESNIPNRVLELKRGGGFEIKSYLWFNTVFIPHQREFAIERTPPRCNCIADPSQAKCTFSTIMSS